MRWLSCVEDVRRVVTHQASLRRVSLTLDSIAPGFAKAVNAQLRSEVARLRHRP
jgi:hypothetical protein